MLNPARIGLLALGLACAESAAFAARPCPLDAVEVFRRAPDAGFSFDLMSGDPARCKRRDSTLTASAPATQPVECLFRILGRRLPAAGWEIQRLVISGRGVDDWRVAALLSTERDKNGNRIKRPQPGWMVRIRVPRGQSWNASIRTVVLSGPDCTRAASAFE
jgi:hypothetical protein